MNATTHFRKRSYNIPAETLRLSKALQRQNPVADLPKLQNILRRTESNYWVPVRTHDAQNNEKNYKTLYRFLTLAVCDKAQSERPIKPEDHDRFVSFLMAFGSNGIPFNTNAVHDYLQSTPKLLEGAGSIFPSIAPAATKLEKAADFLRSIGRFAFKGIDTSETYRAKVVTYLESIHTELKLAANKITAEGKHKNDQEHHVLLHAKSSLILVFEHYLRNSGQFAQGELEIIRHHHNKHRAGDTQP